MSEFKSLKVINDGIGEIVAPSDKEGVFALVEDVEKKQDKMSDDDGGYGQRIKHIEDTLSDAINFEAQKY